MNLVNIGVLYSRVGNSGKALGYLEMALKKARETRVPQDEASALTNIGAVLANQGRFLEARERYRKALAIRREAGSAAKIAHLLVSLAFTSRMSGNAGGARDYLAEAGKILAEKRLDYLAGTYLLEVGSLQLAEKTTGEPLTASERRWSSSGRHRW